MVMDDTHNVEAETLKSASLKITIGRVQKLRELLGKIGLTASQFDELATLLHGDKAGAIAANLRDAAARAGGVAIVAAEADERLAGIEAELRAL